MNVNANSKSAVIFSNLMKDYSSELRRSRNVELIINHNAVAELRPLSPLQSSAVIKPLKCDLPELSINEKKEPFPNSHNAYIDMPKLKSTSVTKSMFSIMLEQIAVNLSVKISSESIEAIDKFQNIVEHNVVLVLK